MKTNPIGCYVFDIDGTLADGSHRLHHIQRTDGKPKDWDAYFSECRNDKPIPHMIGLANTCSQDAPVVYVSGRRESTRQATWNWLCYNKCPIVAPEIKVYYRGDLIAKRFAPPPLYMRPDGDFEDDDTLKIKLLAQVREDGYEPIMVFDDRTRVVDAWRAAGIPCAQVAPGDF